MTTTTRNEFIGLSWNAGAQPPRSLLARLAAVTRGWWRVERAGLLLCAKPSAFHGSDETSPICMTSPLAVNRRGHAYGPDALFDLLRRAGAGEASQMAAPFAALWLDPADGSLRAVTDAYGIGQIFEAVDENIAAASNSVTLLARVFERGLDAQAMTGFAVFGAFQGADTPFERVAKVGPAQAVSFADGRPTRTTSTRDAPAAATSVADLTERLREAVIGLSDAAPDADLQLSGGLDSRLILAALPPQRRRRHRVVTIGSAHSPDVRIAAAISARLGLRHTIVDAAAFDGLDADQLHHLFQLAARGFNCSANPVDKAALLLAERRDDRQAWFNGQNGEILRGFYYPGQPLHGPATAARAGRLLSWRLAVNDVVDPRLFPADAYPALRREAEAKAVARLLSFEGSWPEALDRFYLEERMQRWAGNGTDNLINRTTYLCPFFDRDFVEAAMALPARAKLNSRAAFQMLSALDRDLADMPLDSGLRPLAAVDQPLRARSAELLHFASKVAARLKRKLTGARQATLGSDAAAAHWHRRQLYRRLPHSALLATGLFDRAALDEIVSGRWLPNRPTLGFVLMAAELSAPS